MGFTQPQQWICRELERIKTLRIKFTKQFRFVRKQTITASSQGIVSLCHFRIFCKRRFSSSAAKDCGAWKFRRRKIYSGKRPSHKMKLYEWIYFRSWSSYHIFVFILFWKHSILLVCKKYYILYDKVIVNLASIKNRKSSQKWLLLFSKIRYACPKQCLF